LGASNFVVGENKKELEEKIKKELLEAEEKKELGNNILFCDFLARQEELRQKNNQNAPKKNLQKGSNNFQSYIYQNDGQFMNMEEPHLDDDDDFDPQAEFEKDFGDHQEDLLGFDHPEYYHIESAKCACCGGYINKCNGKMCEILGVCHCFAAEHEEKIYNAKK
jgi:hypothetical protein